MEDKNLRRKYFLLLGEDIDPDQTIIIAFDSNYPNFSSSYFINSIDSLIIRDGIEGGKVIYFFEDRSNGIDLFYSDCKSDIKDIISMAHPKGSCIELDPKWGYVIEMIAEKSMDYDISLLFNDLIAYSTGLGKQWKI